jgi:uncharacterized damage-inducible protein DinB
MLNKIFALLSVGAMLAVPAAAQQAPANAAPPTVAGFVRNLYMGNKNNIVRSADKMPEENYGLRPGTQMEVRTFGQHLLHVATFNYLWCAQAQGVKNPNTQGSLEKAMATASKAEIVKSLNDSFAFCDPAYMNVTDASGAEVLTITQENGREQKQTRLGLLILNVVHNNELYGNIVTTMRIKNIVPPSSEPRPGGNMPNQAPPAK